MILVDTHVFVWLAEDSPRLGRGARRQVERARARGQLGVSAISFWELGMLVEAARLRLSRDLAEVRATAMRAGCSEIAVDGEIGILAARLRALHGDPADRIIVATAICRRATLMTADERVLSTKTGAALVDATR